MNIVSIKTGTGPELRRVELSDGSFFSFKTCYFPYNLSIDEALYTPGTAEGRVLSEGEEEAFRFASACLRAEKAALQLITRAEQTLFGLSRKLERRGHDTACVQLVVARLADLELVDDLRYAGRWLESRIGRRPASPRRLLAALCSRGIDRDIAEKALRLVLDAETEQGLLNRYVQRYMKKHRLSAEDFAAGSGGDLFRALKYQLKNEGFSPAAIRLFQEQEE